MTDDKKFLPPLNSMEFIKDDDPLNTLESRFAQMDSCLMVILSDPEGQLHGLQPIIIHEALWGVQALLHQARKAFKELNHEPKTPVMEITKGGAS